MGGVEGGGKDAWDRQWHCFAVAFRCCSSVMGYQEGYDQTRRSYPPHLCEIKQAEVEKQQWADDVVVRFFVALSCCDDVPVLLTRVFADDLLSPHEGARFVCPVCLCCPLENSG